ncbi:hypothetical protein DM02DRAFT_657349 [Periconia macrospinosa]|uniref:Uncharacterized protein n=1 Tax=Periconia macrospinosa TaxID=97972 RepID=A0A2V1DK68_9PLEO|nr:hypothetical protein DM02DRAFT_657349 [Periconia macrospinosa]
MRSNPSSAMRFLLCSSVVYTASAAVIRAPLEGLLTDGAAGIGAEFESPGFSLASEDTKCSLANTHALKGKVIAGRTGVNWELTADTTERANYVQAEYIIKGENVKVGSTEAATNGAKVAADLAKDLIEWKPWTHDDGNGVYVDIEGSKCGRWKININKARKPEEVGFQPQITAPMPLEAVYSLMEEQVQNPDVKHVLDGTNYSYMKGLQLVTQQHFQSNPAGIDQTKVTDDVLAFCTLVLSYAKGALGALQPGSSPKKLTTFMPRTNFNKIFAHVSSKLPAKGEALWKLFENLACYTGDGNQVDAALCTGTADNPTPKPNKFRDLSYGQGEYKCTMYDWIRSLDPDSQADDCLTKFDRTIDRSIGKLGTRQEKMFNSQRSVPIFEFRDLDTLQTKDMEGFMLKVDDAIQKLHREYANPPGPIEQQSKQLAVAVPFIPFASAMDWLFVTAIYQKASTAARTFSNPWALYHGIRQAQL